MKDHYCPNCSATRPRDEFVRRTPPRTPNGKALLLCRDVDGCEARATARATLYGFRREGCAAKTPAGMALLAVLREARSPLSDTLAEKCVRLMLPDAVEGTGASDIAYARGTGLVVAHELTWRLATGERVEAMLASMPVDGPNARAARAALLVARRP